MSKDVALRAAMGLLEKNIMEIITMGYSGHLTMTKKDGRYRFNLDCKFMEYGIQKKNTKRRRKNNPDQGRFWE